MAEAMAMPRVRAKRRDLSIGMVINSAVKSSRDVMLGIIDCVRQYAKVRPRLFLGSAATTPQHLVTFARNVDGMIVCGIRREILVGFLHEMPGHPPLVGCSYSPLTKGEFADIGCGGMVVLDNAKIGQTAADYFMAHGMKNFAFVGSNVYRERIAGEIRSAAFFDRIKERLGGVASLSMLREGHVEANEDFWDGSAKSFDSFIANLPRPCGILANGDREAFGITDVCNKLRIDVPNQVEIIGVGNAEDICARANPQISSIMPNHTECAQEAVKMVLELIDNPNLPPERRQRLVSSHRLFERGTTMNGRGFRGVAAQAREYIRLNACRGMSVPAVATYLGVARRTLEKRVRDATGRSVGAMIREAKLENVCRLLKTTNLSISEVTLKSGYKQTSNLSFLFKRTFGMSMRQYRMKHQVKKAAK